MIGTFRRRLLPIIGGLLAAMLVTSCTAPTGARLAKPAYDFGPIAAGFADVDGSQHATAAGPFFETARTTNDSTILAVRPFYSKATETNDNRVDRDYLWPIAQTWEFKNNSVSRFGIFMSYNFDTATNVPRDRLWLLPLWFSGRDARGENYWALFPLYGSIHEFIGRDTINFVLFPLHSTSTLKDIETSNWLWPIFSATSTKDGRIRRHRAFPLYSYSYQRDAFTKHAILWPLWSDVQYDYPNEKGGGWILWPLYGQLKTGHEKTIWVVPPFFRFTKGKQLSRILCPWPFIRIERGIGDIRKTYVWPLWGHKRIAGYDSTFYLWPIGWRDHMNRGSRQDDLIMIAPIYRHVTTTVRSTNGVTNVVARQEKVWPLGIWRKDGDVSRFRTLDLWPIAENPHAELDWAPFWTLYSRASRGEDLNSQFLWGMYRHQRRGDEASYFSLFPLVSWRRDDADAHFRGWSFLKGLVAREKTDHGVSWRLLYFLRVGSSEEKKP